MLAALLSMQTLQGFDIRYMVGLIFGVAIYFIAILLLILILFRRMREGQFARGVMAGILYGFLDAAIASMSNGIPIAYEILSIPPELAKPAGLDVSNPILYTLSFIAFWVIVFGAAGRITAAQSRSSR
jgi:hypothetical protein